MDFKDFKDFTTLYGRYCLFSDEGFALWKITAETWTSTPMVFEGVHSFLLVREGEMHVRIDGRACSLSRNGFADILDVMPLELISISRNLQACQLLFTENFLSDLIKNKPPFPSSYILETQKSPVFVEERATMEGYWQRIENIEAVLRNRSHYFRSEMLKNAFWMFLLDVADSYLHRTGSGGEQSESGRMDKLFMQFTRLLPQYIQQGHTVGFYASLLCITPQYLSRIVRRITGESVSGMINRMLTGEIVKLLDDTDKSVQEIALMLHFSDQATLSKFFRRQKGCSPSEYRKSRKLRIHG